MVTLAIFTLNIAHPGLLLGTRALPIFGAPKEDKMSMGEPKELESASSTSAV
jgi:hypothetical protein